MEQIKNLKLNRGDIFYNPEVKSYYVVTKVFKTKNKFYTYEIRYDNIEEVEWEKDDDTKVDIVKIWS